MDSTFRFWRPEQAPTFKGRHSHDVHRRLAFYGEMTSRIVLADHTVWTTARELLRPPMCLDGECTNVDYYLMFR